MQGHHCIKRGGSDLDELEHVELGPRHRRHLGDDGQVVDHKGHLILLQTVKKEDHPGLYRVLNKFFNSLQYTEVF